MKQRIIEKKVEGSNGKKNLPSSSPSFSSEQVVLYGDPKLVGKPRTRSISM
jgi:hypothetical protein